MPGDDMQFSVEEAVSVQRALRQSLGLGAEEFPLSAFIGMISDEIEQCRAAGRSDAELAAEIRKITGKPIDAADLARHFVAERRGG